MEHLETVQVNDAPDAAQPFRMPVQWVNRPNLDFRGFAGTDRQRRGPPGDAVRVLPSGKTTTVNAHRHASTAIWPKRWRASRSR